MKRSHRELRVWQEAVELVSTIYRLTADFPHNERYGLTSQLRRAAVSVPANIAEGAARGTKEYVYFLNICSGSLSELDTLLELAVRLSYVENANEIQEQVDNVAGMIMGLSTSLKKRS